MTVKETGVSYYGLTYPEHAAKDFEEMLDHNCNAVLLAITEFDFDFWYPNVLKIVKKAKEMGLRVYLDLWGIGKFFGGEPPSQFLQNHIKSRQVTSFSNEPVPAACFNTPAFRSYFLNRVKKLANEADSDGFLWDEPHYAIPEATGVGSNVGTEWTCRCEVCQHLFREEYGYEMPKILVDDVINFRQDKAIEILAIASKIVKKIDPKLKVIICPVSTISTGYFLEAFGYENWDKICAIKEFDVFSTSIISYSKPRDFFIDVTKRTVEIAKKYGKESQRWIQSFYQSPKDLEEINYLVKLFAEMGVDSIFSWTYRAGKGTVLSAPEPEKVWDLLGRAYGEVLKK